MKTTKFFYQVDKIISRVGGVCFEKVCSFPVLAMARQYCLFNRGHFRIVCLGYVEYKDGLEVK